MYSVKDDSLTRAGYWFLNESLVLGVVATKPIYEAFEGEDALTELDEVLPLDGLMTEQLSCVHTMPLFDPLWCEKLVDELDLMSQTIPFKPNPEEDEARQMPEIVLQNECVDLFLCMNQVVKDILSYAIWTRYGTRVMDVASIQIANYRVIDKAQGAWHHDQSADFTVVVPLNTGCYEGGGTEFFRLGKVDPIPTGSALIFPAGSHMHRGLKIESGDRYLLVFWLYDRERVFDMIDNLR